MSANARFFWFFAVGYFAFVTAAWFLAGQPIQGSPAASGGLVVIRAVLTPFLMSSGLGERHEFAVLYFLLSSVVIAGIATAVYAFVRKLRAA